jgi:hypothetical protein
MKQQLANLIEAYAASRASGNVLLIEYAASKLNELIATVEITTPQEGKNDETSQESKSLDDET